MEVGDAAQRVQVWAEGNVAESGHSNRAESGAEKGGHVSKADRAMGDLDEASSNSQVSKVYQPSSNKDALAGKDIDEGHGGINSTVNIPQRNDVVATHNSTANTPEDMGIS